MSRKIFVDYDIAKSVSNELDSAISDLEKIKSQARSASSEVSGLQHASCDADDAENAAENAILRTRAFKENLDNYVQHVREWDSSYATNLRKIFSGFAAQENANDNPATGGTITYARILKLAKDMKSADSPLFKSTSVPQPGDPNFIGPVYDPAIKANLLDMLKDEMLDENMLSVLTPEQRAYAQKISIIMLSCLTEEQLQALVDGGTLGELTENQQLHFTFWGQRINESLSPIQLVNLRFNDSMMRNGLTLEESNRVFSHLKENEGNIGADDLVKLGFFSEETRYNKVLLITEDIAATMAAMVSAEYMAMSNGTSLVQLEYEYQQRLNRDRTMLLALSVAQLVDYFQYGPSGVYYSPKSALDMLEKNKYITRQQYNELIDRWKKPNLYATPTLKDHIQTRQLFDKNGMPYNNRRGIVGAHNETEFNKYDKNIVKVEDVYDINGNVVPGVKKVTYNMPALDKAQNLTGNYSSQSLDKTVYDPGIMTDSEYVNRGLEAAGNAVDPITGQLPEQWQGYDSQGVYWEGFYREGAIDSFYPITSPSVS